MRIIAVLLFIGTGVGFLAYIVGWIIIPKRDHDFVAATNETDGTATEAGVEVTFERRPAAWHKYLPGLILIFIGVIFLVDQHCYWVDFDLFWPAILIIGGLWLIFRRNDNRHATAPDPAAHQAELNNGGTTE